MLNQSRVLSTLSRTSLYDVESVGGRVVSNAAGAGVFRKCKARAERAWERTFKYVTAVSEVRNTAVAGKTKPETV
jgi:hypothetical protein